MENDVINMPLHEVSIKEYSDSHDLPKGYRETSFICLNHPFCHTAMIALGLYLIWAYPVRGYIAAFPLLVSMLIMVFYSAKGSRPETDSSVYTPGSQVTLRAKSDFYKLGIIFIGIPLTLSAMGIIIWPVSIYVAACAAVLLSGAQYANAGNHRSIHASRGKPGWQVGNGQCTTVAWYSLVTITICYLVLLYWPHIASRGVTFPIIFAHIISGMERLISGTTGLFGIGASPVSAFGDSHAIITRNGDVGLVGNRIQPTVFLLSSEHTYTLLCTFLLLGSFIRSFFLCKGKRVKNLTEDAASVALLMVLYLIATWSDILKEYSGSTLHEVRIFGAVCLITLWLTIRYTMNVAFQRERISAPYGSRQSLDKMVQIEIPGLRSISLPVLILLFVGFLMLWHEPGVAKKGRILMDETHSEWERSDLPMNKSIYGVKTVYNYSFLSEILKKHFSCVDINRQPISPALLSDYDVLILKTPTKPYSAEEINAIYKFVENGGGLWLIGDHTNIFGMNTYLNQVSKEWGIYFNPDAVCVLQDYYQQLVHVDGVPDYHRCGKRGHETLFSKRYLNHPILGHNIPYLSVLTSCSVTSPFLSSDVTISRGTYIDNARFGGNTFFGNLKYDHEEYYGTILQNVSLKIKKGRVATWSDSTLFSNFSMCMTGVPELAIGYINWLNRSNIFSSRFHYSILFLLLLMYSISVILRRRRTLCLLYSTYTALLLLGFLVLPIDLLNTCTYAIEDISKGFRTVGFDQQYGHIDLPNKDHVHNDDPICYERFYVMMQRLHLMPISYDSLIETLESDLTVIINPMEGIGPNEVEKMKESLHLGKSILFMLNGSEGAKLESCASSINDILDGLGVEARLITLKEKKVTDIYGSAVGQSILLDVQYSAFIDIMNGGGEVLMRSAEGRPLMTIHSCGKGKIAVCSIGEKYNNMAIGVPGAVPSNNQAVLIQSGFKLVEEILKLSDEDTPDYLGPWNQILEDQISGK